MNVYCFGKNVYVYIFMNSKNEMWKWEFEKDMLVFLFRKYLLWRINIEFICNI